ncbi:hypothetical protein [Enterobacter hormaechei]|uniref:hypothetical protein n=1 Tax=Enterobacter hormaechei TaxID=158836 RepID=UPI00286762EA|nr:hypothetical protein [Enterobacter hormaechei]
MFIPMWLIIVLVIVAVLYVMAVNVATKDNKHKVKKHLERLKIEANYLEIDFARNFYNFAWKLVIFRVQHAIDVAKNLKESRNYTALSIGENFLYNVDEHKELIEEILKGIKQNTGFDLERHKDDISTTKYLEEWLNKYDSKVQEIRDLMQEVSLELD